MIRIYLSRLLGERRWTQSDLAKKTGIRPTTINEIYHELVERVNLEHLDKICETLDCSLSDPDGIRAKPYNDKRFEAIRSGLFIVSQYGRLTVLFKQS